MRKLYSILALFFGALILSSCGTGYAITLNANQNNTQVELGENNFRVVGKVTGTAELDYVFFFGGWKKRNLYAQAYQNMIDQADLEGQSKALVNVLSEEFIGGLPPFYTKRQITVSAQVIEFVD